MKVAVVLRGDADGPALRYRVARIAREFDVVVLRIDVARRTVDRAPASPPSFVSRVVGKARGLYARTNYPARYFDLSAAVEAARARWLPLAPALDAYPTRRVPSSAPSSAETRDAIADSGADVVLPSIGIVRAPLFDATPLGCLNVHHGWLPAIRGMWSALHAIVEDHPDWIGVSVHRIDAGIDTGPILSRARPEFGPMDSHESLYVRLDLLAADELVRVLHDLAEGTSLPMANDAGQGVYRSRPTFAQHLALERRERAFFRKHGTPGCPALRDVVAATIDDTRRAGPP